MESDHQITREIPHDQWVIDVENDLRANRFDGDDSEFVGMAPICRVPAKVREKNVKAYEPEVVSIGPYHQGVERLLAMEKHKRRALLYFLCRTNQQTPAGCLERLRGNKDGIMGAYHNLDEKWRNDHELFLKLMLMDGCFIVEIMLTSVGTAKGYLKGDSIFCSYEVLYNAPSIRRDLLLIENQIPLLVLRTLFSFADAKADEVITKYLNIGRSLEFLTENGSCGRIKHSMCGIFRDHYRSYPEQSLHILDLNRQILIFSDEDGGVPSTEEGTRYNLKKLSAPKIPSAMALRDHGIVLRKGRLQFLWYRSQYRLLALFGYCWRLFGYGLRLKLPELTVDDTTESVFLNAMVFESLPLTADARFTSYVSLMSNLIVSPKDANLLSTERGIIRNALGSDQALVDLFGRLSLANFLPDNQSSRLQKRILKYCGRKRNRLRAYINRTYFRNPWAQISFYSAIVLFILTAVQTFFTVYPYYTNKYNPK